MTKRFIKPEVYFEESCQGKHCAIVGCPVKPTYFCPRCGGGYCEEHKEIHFHVVKRAKCLKEENRLGRTKG